MLAGTVLLREEASSPAARQEIAPSPSRAPPLVVTCIPGARYRCARSHESRDDGSVTLELEQPRVTPRVSWEQKGTDALRLPVKRTDIAYRSLEASWLFLGKIISGNFLDML